MSLKVTIQKFWGNLGTAKTFQNYGEPEWLKKKTQKRPVLFYRGTAKIQLSEDCSQKPASWVGEIFVLNSQPKRCRFAA